MRWETKYSCDSLFCSIQFMAVVWKQAHNISEVYLYWHLWKRNQKKIFENFSLILTLMIIFTSLISYEPTHKLLQLCGNFIIYQIKYGFYFITHILSTHPSFYLQLNLPHTLPSPHPRHAKFSGPGIKPTPQQYQ